MTLSHIEEKFQRLGDRLELGTDLARILGCIGVWQKFEKLRNMDAPFDRKEFIEFIENVFIWSERYSGRQGIDNNGKTSGANDVEKFTGNLYAKCWLNYEQQQYIDTVNMFERRFRNNGIDPAIVSGKTCLDAGCGGGRYSIAMHKLGAEHVTGVDLSKEALEDANRRRDANGISAEEVGFKECSVLELPQEWSDHFDFINCNGVLHHTINPESGMKGLFRVLKPGGQAFIMVYGAGGLHWLLVDWVRGVLKDINELDVRNLLHLLDFPPGRIFHIMDHWFVPNYERLTTEEFETKLSSTGFEELHKLPRGLFMYDSSERNFVYPEDRDLFGHGELRYMVQKPSQ